MSDGRTEARVAAHWWADRLADRDVDIRTGDAMNEAFALSIKRQIPQPTAEQVEAFREHLERALMAGPVASDGWREAVARGETRWGSAMRSFGVDYGPDPILDESLIAAGLDQSWRKLLLPLKTVMWFNPGSITVSLGYDGAERELDLS